MIHKVVYYVDNASTDTHCERNGSKAKNSSNFFYNKSNHSSNKPGNLYILVYKSPVRVIREWCRLKTEIDLIRDVACGGSYTAGNTVGLI